MTHTSEAWPRLVLSEWEATYRSLHLWTQVVGKVRLACMPWINHSWHVALYPTVRGLTTSTIFDRGRAFEVAFDFLEHRLDVAVSDGSRSSFPLQPMSVAEFYEMTMSSLQELGIEARILPRPVELPDPVVPFPMDRGEGAYDAAAVERYWRALLQVTRVFTAFRARFTGKVSPVHFFWGAFDLAVTRFSGRPAPPHPGGIPNAPDWMMAEAYSHELSSAGFWPGLGVGEAAFYSYAYPEPEGFREYPVQPAAAYYDAGLGEFILPYEAVRTAPDPDAALLEFLQSTYQAAAEGGGWDRAALERSAEPGLSASRALRAERRR